MTVSEAIIKWLKTFSPEEYWKMKHIDTDLQAAEVESYSVVKAPVQNVKNYLSGKKVYTDHYMIQARLSNKSNTDRIENNGFGEALEAFVEEKNRKKEFPDINGTVQKISTTTPFHVGVTENNDSIYQMTIAIKYEKES